MQKFYDNSTKSHKNRKRNMADKVLIVDDDISICKLLEKVMHSNELDTEVAGSGKEALELLKHHTYDVILMDIMLGDMEGFDVIKELRASGIQTPVMIVSGRNEDYDSLYGLSIGADDYITKPFSATYLKARVKNLLTQRQKLQGIYRNNLMTGTLATTSEEETVEEKGPEMSSNDRKFMDKLVDLMEKNMDNGELVVDDLVQELAVSRSVFFKKLKTLTGLAPIEFIKEMRIKRAVQLIETGEYSMTQIAYMVGINDPRYFSKCFKQKMGMTPTEYRDKGKK